MNFNTLDKKAIKAIVEHVKTGYYSSCYLTILGIKQGKIRLRATEDNYYCIKSILGDLFSPYENPEICPKLLLKQEKAYKAKVYRNKVWTMYGEYWTGREWIECDSIGGFVGNDFFGSGYEMQVLGQALDNYNSQQLDRAGYVIDPFKL